MDFEASLKTAEELCKKKNYHASVRESGALLENLLRKLLNDVIIKSKDSNDKQLILDAEKKIGKEKLTISSMGLGQLIGIYRSCDAWKIIRKMVKDNCSFVNKLDFDEMCELRNKAVHNPDSKITYDEAFGDLYLPVKKILYKLEIIEANSKNVKVSTHTEPGTCKSGNCSQPMKKSWNYCPECGCPSHINCSNCERELLPDMKICPYCENPVTEFAKKEKQSNLDELRILVRGALLDNYINKAEKSLLESKRIELGIEDDEFEKLKNEYLSPEVKDYTQALEMISIDGIVSKEERAYLDKKIVDLKLDETLVKQLEKTYLP